MSHLERIHLTSDLKQMIMRESRQGKSIGRILMNYLISQQKLSGAIIDLGSKDSHASYNRFMCLQEPYSLTYTDLHTVSDDIIQLDLEEPFPLPSERYQIVMCFNALEHVYNYTNVLAETMRILVPGGQLIGSTPFLVNYHPDPQDFFRYTHEALGKMLQTAGFQQYQIYSLGFGPMTAAYSLTHFVWPRFLRGWLVAFTLWLDAGMVRYKPSLKDKFPESYFFIAKKS